MCFSMESRESYLIYAEVYMGASFGEKRTLVNSHVAKFWGDAIIVPLQIIPHRVNNMSLPPQGQEKNNWKPEVEFVTIG